MSLDSKNTRSCINQITKMLWPVTLRNPTLYFPQERQVRAQDNVIEQNDQITRSDCLLFIYLGICLLICLWGELGC